MILATNVRSYRFKALLTACMLGGRKDIARKYALEMQGAFDPAKLQQSDVTALLKFATSSDETPAAATKAST